MSFWFEGTIALVSGRVLLLLPNKWVYTDWLTKDSPKYLGSMLDSAIMLKAKRQIIRLPIKSLFTGVNSETEHNGVKWVELSGWQDFHNEWQEVDSACALGNDEPADTLSVQQLRSQDWREISFHNILLNFPSKYSIITTTCTHLSTLWSKTSPLTAFE